MSSTVKLLQAKATFDGGGHDVHVRTARKDHKVYVDLCSDEWKAVEIDEVGWRIVDPTDAGVFFVRRGNTALPLPQPQEGGGLQDLRDLLNVDDDGWALILAFMVFALAGDGPFPLLAVSGEQGTAKSTMSRIISLFVDPSRADLRRPPRNEDDLAVAATGSHLLVYDNVSRIPPWMSDAFCVVTTGGSICKRTHYSNDGETVLQFRRPMIITSIKNVIEANDLSSRALQVSLRPIDSTARQTESEVMTKVAAMRPQILGVLFSAVSCALRKEREVSTNELSRLADFCRFAAASETALGLEDGGFMEAYRRSQEGADREIIESSGFGMRVLHLAEEHGDWTGTMAELIKELGDDVPEPKWPWGARKAGGEMRTLAPAFRLYGLNIVEPKSTDRPRIYWLKFTGPVPAVGPSPDGAVAKDRRGENDHQDTDRADSRLSDGPDGPSQTENLPSTFFQEVGCFDDPPLQSTVGTVGPSEGALGGPRNGGAEPTIDSADRRDDRRNVVPADEGRSFESLVLGTSPGELAKAGESVAILPELSDGDAEGAR